MLDYLKEHQITFSKSNITSKDGQATVLVNECGMESRTGILDSLRHIEGVVDVVHHS